jgi:hypothetical protein
MQNTISDVEKGMDCQRTCGEPILGELIVEPEKEFRIMDPS